MEYEFNVIEKKWQTYWEQNKTFKALSEDSKKAKYYVLDMFPYPSGAGLHVGHPEGYTATDIMARYKRMKGFNVLHPMGWDSFGLPAENHAVRTGVHPAITTEKNIQTFKRQLKSLGFSYDWDREVATSQKDYYRWTQWIFIQLYQKGLAYESDILVNWCPELKTVLANEEVINGKSEIGGHPVIRKPMKQWVLQITAYAERLLEDLEGLHWPQAVKDMQKAWIGKSQGVEFSFPLKNHPEISIPVFTTRIDTLFGVSYVVVAPEYNAILPFLTSPHRESVKAFIEQVSKKSDLERTDLNKDKSGVFTGLTVIHPVTKKEIPLWMADYVLMSYGTGAVMAVPAHDERDFEFATKYHLPIIPVVEGFQKDEGAFTGDAPHMDSDFLNGLFQQEAIEKMTAYLEKQSLGKRKINYKLHDWPFSRQRYWGEPFPLLKYEDGTIRCLDEDELPVELPPVERYEPTGTGESPLASITSWVNVICPKTGKKARRETHTMPQWAGSCWYYLRFLDPHNTQQAFDQKKEQYWMPVDLYVGGMEHAVLHLLYARFWHKVLFDLGYVSTKEPFQKLVNQGLILGPDGEKMSKSRGNVINPDSIVDEFGADTLRVYEMFMGPLEKTKPWSTNGVKGVHSFLQRVWRFLMDPSHLFEDRAEDVESSKMLHKTLRIVTEDIDSMKFNTAISQMMIFNNFCMKKGQVHRETAKIFALMLSPFAPHMAEEMWQTFTGSQESLAYHAWPMYDEQLAQDEKIEMAVQINGKTRDILLVSTDLEQEDFLDHAKKSSKLEKYFDPQAFQILKIIYVKNKICNLVVKEISG
jgi:leucyl-tRNA synthetase